MLFWAVVVLTAIMYIFSVLILYGMGRHVEQVLPGSAGSKVQELQKLYGSFGKCLYTLFSSVTGSDWGNLALPLSEVHWIYIALWVVYVAFVVLGGLNVLTGAFVHMSIQAASGDQSLASEAHRRQRREMVCDVVASLRAAGVADVEAISEEDYFRLLADPRIQFHLSCTGITKVEEMASMFQVLDATGEGSVPVDVLIDGLLLGRGARASDVMALLSAVSSLTDDVGDMKLVLRQVSAKMRDVFRKDQEEPPQKHEEDASPGGVTPGGFTM